MTEKRFILLVSLIFCFSSTSWSQTGTESIAWKNPIQLTTASGAQVTVLNFTGAGYSALNSYLPTLNIQIKNAQNVNFSVLNPIYTALTEQELSLIGSTKIPSNYGITVSSGIASKIPISTVSLIPIAINPSTGGYEKLVSFQYSYQIIPSLRTAAVAAVNYASQSALSSGSWYKLSIPSTGIYKIDYAFLQSIGIQPQNVDPNTLRLLGNGGGMLPQNDTAFRYDDIQENPIYVYNGSGNSSFDPGDYILFYGTGPDTWAYNSNGTYTHTKNIYSDSTFYFLTYGGNQGLRISSVPNPPSGAPNSITTYTDYALHETDQVNLLHSGRQWLGETFNETTTSVTLPAYTFYGLVQSSSNKIRVNVVASLPSSTAVTTEFEVSVGGTIVGTISLPNVPTATYSVAGSQRINSFTLSSLNSNTPTFTVGLTYNQQGNPSALGYLDYIELNIERTIELYKPQNNFRCAAQSSGLSTFTVNNVSDNTVSVWDVTTPINPQNQPFTLAGNNQAVFTANTSKAKEYVVFQGTSFSNPSFVGTVGNQNLHGITTFPTLAIITTNAFTNEAAKFQTFKTDQGISTSVYYLEEIYNEFSSGAQDITAIRDFLRMLYTKSNNLKYLLLFGDCSYDYKNRVSNNTNIVPVYESIESLSPTATFSSDDYYAILDPGEGTWAENGSDNPFIDLGVGRFPVKTSAEADAIINKISNYVTNTNCLGKWRNQIAIVTGIDPTNSIPFINDAETNVIPYIPSNYNIDKLYMAAYPLVSTPDGTTCPDMNTAIEEEIGKGALIIDYLGHGGQTVWAQQDILTTAMISQWTNLNELPFFVTATCDFGVYDDPTVDSGSETLLLSGQGGSIGSLSSTRPVDESYNNLLNRGFTQNVFTSINKSMPALGDVMKAAKNEYVASTQINNRNYALLGDPSLTLAYPKDQIYITKINNVAVTPSVPDTINALEKLTISGVIRSPIDSSLQNNFNGTLYITMYDKPSEVVNSIQDFYSWNNLLYEGSATVKNGAFTLSFVVPKDIAYNYGYGKISLYAEETATPGITPIDANGIDTSIVIGGSIANPPVDITPPTVKLYMQDSTFVNGGLTGSNTVLIAHLTDANGINVSDEGIGHGITAVLDGNTESVLNLNSYYIANKDSYTAGTISFPINGLSPGMHTIQLTAWDTYDNSAVVTIEFEVTSSANLAVQNVLNYPNPFSTSTTFHFDQNREGDDLEVLIQIYTASGQLIHSIDERISSSTAHIATTEWNGRDDYGDKLGKGVYVYKLKARSLRDGSDTFKYQKLVILN